MYLTLSDVDICKVRFCDFPNFKDIWFVCDNETKCFQTKEDNLKKMMKEYGDIENDLKTVQSICKLIFI